MTADDTELEAALELALARNDLAEAERQFAKAEADVQRAEDRADETMSALVRARTRLAELEGREAR